MITENKNENETEALEKKVTKWQSAAEAATTSISLVKERLLYVAEKCNEAEPGEYDTCMRMTELMIRDQTEHLDDALKELGGK